MSCPDDYCHPDWTWKRPSEWTEGERQHVRRLVKGGAVGLVPETKKSLDFLVDL